MGSTACCVPQGPKQQRPRGSQHSIQFGRCSSEMKPILVTDLILERTVGKNATFLFIHKSPLFGNKQLWQMEVYIESTIAKII